jgi:hypothetical protein
MTDINLTLTLLPDTFAMCQLETNSEIPEWALVGEFFSITRTADELSIVCRQRDVLKGIRCEEDYRCFKVKGPLEFALTGILDSLTTPLAQAGVSVLAVSTFDTDYLLVKEDTLKSAVGALKSAGHQVIQQEIVRLE